MTGKTDLEVLLYDLSPVLLEGEYVFCTLENSQYGDYAVYNPLASFVEAEGLTLVLAKGSAEMSGLSYEGEFRCITLNVHSSLQAIGLTAAVSTALTRHQISANVIAGYYHDHIFVQSNLADQALGILLDLATHKTKS